MYAYFILCYVFIYVICYKTVLIWSIGLISHALLEPHLFTFYSFLISKIGRYSFPDKIYLFKVNKKKTEKRTDIAGIVFLFLFLILNMFHTFFQCCYCWIWTGRCFLICKNHLLLVARSLIIEYSLFVPLCKQFWKSLTIFTKSSILDVWQGSEFTFGWIRLLKFL